jgi:hypothetical protein
LRFYPLSLDLELLHKIPQLINAEADEMAADFARVDVAEFHPLFELRFTHAQKFARALHVHVPGEFIYALELKCNGVSHSADQNFVGYVETEHHLWNAFWCEPHTCATHTEAANPRLTFP